jgi:Flp pilus assembly pilin Flp
MLTITRTLKSTLARAGRDEEGAVSLEQAVVTAGLVAIGGTVVAAIGVAVNALIGKF